MSFEVIESLREVFNHLKTHPVDAIVKDNFESALEQAIRSWKSTDTQTKATMTVLVTAIFSKVLTEAKAMIDMFMLIVREVRIESTLSLGILLCSTVKKDKLKEALLQNLTIMETPTILPFKQKLQGLNPLEKEAKSDIFHLVQSYAKFMLKETGTLDYMRLRKEIEHLTDIYCISAFYRVISEHVFICNRAPLSKYSLTQMETEEIGLIIKFSLKKLYKFNIEQTTTSEINAKSIPIVSQSISERVFMALRSGEGTDMIYALKAVYELKQQDVFINCICAKMCSEIKSNPNFVDLVESIKLGIRALELLCEIDQISLKKISALMLLNLKTYLKSHRLNISQSAVLQTSIFRLLALTHDSSLQLNYDISKDLLLAAYRMILHLVDESPSIFTAEVIDQLMTQNTKRSCRRIKAKEIDVILWIIFKAADAAKYNGRGEGGHWEGFFRAVFSYAKEFDERYRLGVQLSALELLTGLVKKHGEQYHSNLEGIFKQFKDDIEGTFQNAKSTDFCSLVRYLNYRLSNVLAQSKNTKDFSIEASLGIKENLSDIQTLLLRESSGSLSEDHSIKLLKALNDTNRFQFIKTIADSPHCIRALDNIASVAKLHHFYSLEALTLQCNLLVLMYESNKFSSSDEKIPDIHSTLLLSTTCRYASSLQQIADPNAIAWMAHSCRLLRSSSAAEDKLGEYLNLSALQSVKSFVRSLGSHLCSRYDISVDIDDIDRQVIESVTKHKSSVRHFMCYLRLVEDKVNHSGNGYTRAVCIKELVNAVACLKEQISLHDWSEIREEMYLEERSARGTPVSHSLADTNMYFTEMSIVFRRILRLAFTSAAELTMYNLCKKASQLLENLSMVTQAFDDNILYLQTRSLLKKVDFSEEKVAKLFDLFNIDMRSKLGRQSSWRSVMEQSASDLEGIYKAVHSSNYPELNTLLATVINDSLTKAGYPVCKLADCSLAMESFRQGQSDRSGEPLTRVLLDMIVSKLDPLFPDLVDTLFRNKDLVRNDLNSIVVDKFCSELDTLIKDDNLTASLKDKKELLKHLNLNILTVFFSRVASFNRDYEILLGKVSYRCFWISVFYGLHSLSRNFIEIVVHFAFCHFQPFDAAKSSQRSFWLSAKEFCKMIQFSINPSYDIKRFVKLIGLDLLKKRDSYGRQSLKRLTMRRAQNFKEFYKYSLILKGSLGRIDLLQREHFESFSSDPSTPLLIVSSAANLLDCLSRSNQIPILCRNDGSQWTFSIKSPDLSSALLDMIDLLSENERELRETMDSENIRAREFWNMRHRYEQQIAEKMAAIENSLSDEVLLFDGKFRIPVGGGNNEKEARKAAFQRVLRFKDHTASSNSLIRKLSLKYPTESSGMIQSSSSTVSSKGQTQSSLLLMIDGPIFTVPFEHLPAVTELGSQIYRVPHISECSSKTGISKDLKTSKFDNFSRNIDEDQLSLHTPRCYYLVNPSGDLKATETRMKDYLDKKIFQWKGLIGTEPKGSEIATYLKNNCHFLFIGHGAGDTYFNHDYLNRLVNLNNIVILMGCCSAGMFPLKDHSDSKLTELDGIVNDYLSSQS